MRISTINITHQSKPTEIVVNKTITIPIATATKLGGVKPGTNVKVNETTGQLTFELTQDIIDQILEQVDDSDDGGSSVPSNNDLVITDGSSNIIWTIKLSSDGQSLAFVNTAGTEVLKLSQTGALTSNDEITAFN